MERTEITTFYEALDHQSESSSTESIPDIINKAIGGKDDSSTMDQKEPRDPYMRVPTEKYPLTDNFNTHKVLGIEPSIHSHALFSRFELPRISSFSSVDLVETAKETIKILEALLDALPECEPTTSLCAVLPDLPSRATIEAVGARKCTIRVVNMDSLDAALNLFEKTRTVANVKAMGPNDKPVLVLNLANPYHPGGGWVAGTNAQEESICYRSSLSKALKAEFYPLPVLGALYSPVVVVFRKSIFAENPKEKPHRLMDMSTLSDLPIISVISSAAIIDPIKTMQYHGLGLGLSEYPYESHIADRYARKSDESLMRHKIKQILRLAAHEGHRKIVLGALGCGVFGNPKEAVAAIFKEVFEEEWQALGWWEEVVFAVLDQSVKRGGSDSSSLSVLSGDTLNDGNLTVSDLKKFGKKEPELGYGNYAAFYRALNGIKI